jgi:hypothetical protein
VLFDFENTEVPILNLAENVLSCSARRGLEQYRFFGMFLNNDRRGRFGIDLPDYFRHPTHPIHIRSIVGSSLGDEGASGPLDLR